MRDLSIALVLVGLVYLHYSLRKLIMATHSETEAALDALHTQVTKVVTEVQALKDVIAQNGNTPPNVTAALGRVQAALQGLDDLNPDAPAPAPAPTPNP